MHRDQLGLLIAVALCMLVAPGGAQAVEDPAASPPAVRSPKSAPQKIAHRHERSSVMSLGAIGRLPAPRSDNPVAKFDASDQATKAKTLEEGRKKFFEQSSGFDNSQLFGTGVPGAGGAPSSGSSPPGMGFRF